MRKGTTVLVRSRYGPLSYVDDPQSGRYRWNGHHWIRELTVTPEVNYTDVETAVARILEAAAQLQEGGKSTFEVETYEEYESTYVHVQIRGTRAATDEEVARVIEQLKADRVAEQMRADEMRARTLDQIERDPKLKSAIRELLEEGDS